MEYHNILFKGEEWYAPSFVIPSDHPLLLAQSYDFAVTNRNSRSYCASFGFKAKRTNGRLQIPALQGKTVVDLCSGFGELNLLAESVERLIRIDPIYEDQVLLRSLKSKANGLENKLSYHPTSSFDTSLESNKADLCLENWGTTYYFESVLFSGVHDSFMVMEQPSLADPLDVMRTSNNYLLLLCSFLEKIRITKPGGTIMMGPRTDNYGHDWVSPCIDSLVEQGLVKKDRKKTDNSGEYNFVLSVLKNL